MIEIGILDSIFKRPTQAQQQVNGYFTMLSGYTPVFNSFEGGLYEMELTRAAIHSFANHCSKLKPEIVGTAYKSLQKTLQYKPNPFMDTSKFLYRIATILSVNNNCFIVPITDDTGEIITGYYPLLPSRCEVVDVAGQPWLRYTFANGQKASIEFDRVGIMNQFQYKDDIFGSSNDALNPTMQLISTQNQGIINGVKSSANIRFIARIAQLLSSKDLAAERQRFTEENLSADNQSGMLIYDNKFSDVQQVNNKPFLVDTEQIKLIQENVYNYFGTNTDILQNKAIGDSFSAYYEGKIEPFALQLSLVMTNMTFTLKEISFKNEIVFTANRMQYMTNSDKLKVSVQLFDRGLLNRNGCMDIFNMAHVEDGDKYYIRREYTEVSKLNEGGAANANNAGQGIQSNIATPDDTTGQ